ncbi:MAG: hypothetical protein ABUT39_28325 [Acidobacteriota bacterium]
MPYRNTASMAKELLYRAAQRLGTANPLEDVSDVLDESLAFPLGEPAGGPRALEPSFSETAPENLSFLVTRGGPSTTPSDRIESATQALYQVAGHRFGPEALHWLDSRLEAVKSRGHHRSASWGASFSSGFDRNGVTEAAMHYELGPMLMDALPAPLFRMARAAMESLPGLRPAVSSVRCGRASGSQQITFSVDRALPLPDLKPLMDRLGLGARHASLMSACAFVLGARFTLPPDTAMLTLRPSRTGVELRLDVDLDALPDPPAQLMALMRLQMTERPRGLQALDRWLMALTPDGYPGPGTVSVLSVWVRPDLPARLALYLRPAALTAEPKPAATLKPASGPASSVSSGVAAEAAWAASAWAP